MDGCALCHSLLTRLLDLLFHKEGKTFVCDAMVGMMM